MLSECTCILQNVTDCTVSVCVCMCVSYWNLVVYGYSLWFFFCERSGFCHMSIYGMCMICASHFLPFFTVVREIILLLKSLI